MANNDQATGEQPKEPETVITVDLDQADPNRAVARQRPRSDIAAATRDDERGTGGRSRIERDIFKRMNRMQRNFQQQLAAEQASWQRENAELRRQVETLKVERGGGSGEATDHERKMAELEAQLAAAHERGDSTEAAKITAKMTRAEAEYHAKLTGTAVRADAGQTPAAAAASPAATGPTPAGSRFILANEEWWEDPDHQIEKDAASSIYLNLIRQEGFSADDDETFREVASRLKDKFPKLDVKAGRSRRQADDRDPGDEDDEEVVTREPRRAAAARFADRGPANARAASRNTRTLTADEVKTMRAVGMDPMKDDHVLRFLREAQAMEA